jgi:hemoglobin/transferrin/lactoferrin receptor protein
MAWSNSKDRRRRGRGVLAATLMASASIGPILITVGGTAYAQSTPRTFSIPAGPLSQALASFGRQSGLQVTYPAEITAGKQSPGVNGSATPEQALAQLLRGSGLSYSFPNPRTVSISAPGARADSAATVEGAIQLDTINVSGGAVSPQDRPYVTPGSSSFISREQIETTRGTSVGDTFKGVPGVLSGDDNNGPKFDPSIRGLGIDRVPVRIDGASASVSEYRGYSGAATSNYVDPDLIGGITIKKGPDAGPEGAGAIGGLVSLRTLNADDIIKPGKDFGIRLRGGFSDNTRSPVPWQVAGINAGGPSSLWDANSYFSSAAFATKQSGFDLVAAYAHRESGNYFAGTHGPQYIDIPSVLDRNRPGAPIMRPAQTKRLSDYYGPGSEVLNTSQNMDSLLLKGTLKFDANHTLELAHLGYRNSFGQSMPSMTQISVTPDWNKQLETAETRQNNYTARYRWKPDDNDLIDLKINSFLTDLRNETMMNAQVATDLGSGVEPFMSSRIRTWGINISNTSRFDTHWGDVSLNYGASYNDEDMIPLQSRQQMSFLSSNGTRQMVGIFTNGEWTPAHWLKFNAGVRYDSYRTKDRANVQDLQSPGNGGLNPALAGFSFHGDGVSPHASVTVTPFEGLQLYGLYAEGFRPPNIWEATNNVIAINPNLRPERAQNWEFGVNVSRDNVLMNGDKARLKVSYFDNTIHDVIVRDYYFRVPNLFSFYYRRNNYDRAHFTGIEVSGRYDTGKVFTDFSATYYDKVEYCRNPYPNVPGQYYYPNYGTGCQDSPYANDYLTNQVPPKFSASATLGVRLLDDRLTLAGRATYMGDRGGSYLDFVLPSTLWVAYTVYDAFASYKIDENLRLDASVENLTDRYYFKPLSQATLPAPGRTIRMSLTGTFDGSERGASFRPYGMPMKATKAAPDSHWTGFYIGSHLGIGFGRDERHMTSLTGTSDDSAVQEVADHKFRDLNRGLQAGFNYQLGNRTVLGLESDISWLGYDDTSEMPSLEGGANALEAKVHTRLDWLATLRGRVGYAIDKRWMLYGTAGAAFLRQTEQRSQFVGPRTGRTAPVPSFSESVSSIRPGFAVGAGTEYAIADGWSLKAEYLYAGFGAESFLFPNARANVMPNAETTGRRLSSSVGIHMQTIGVNYRF